MFCRIRVSFEYSKVSSLENRGHFIDEKVSGKGSLDFRERSYVLPFASDLMSGGVAAGTSPHPQGRQAVIAHAHWVRF